MAELTTFLRREVRRPHRFGVADCLLFPADWWLTMTGRDPAEALRGTYDDEASAEALVAALGGLEALTTALMAEAGGDLVETAQAMDVGLVRAIGASGPVVVGGVHTGRRWAARAKQGLAFGLTAEPVRIWRWRGEWRR